MAPDLGFESILHLELFTDLLLGTIFPENKIPEDCCRGHVVDFAALNLFTKGKPSDEFLAK